MFSGIVDESLAQVSPEPEEYGGHFCRNCSLVMEVKSDDSVRCQECGRIASLKAMPEEVRKKEAKRKEGHRKTVATQSNQPALGPTVHVVSYICGNCREDVDLKTGDPLLDRECGYRILFKKRCRKPMQYHAV